VGIVSALSDRIEAALFWEAPLTATDISRSVRARDKAVRETLKADDRFVAVRLPGRSCKAVGWMLRAVVTDESGRVTA